jgi:hypothetical protein
LQTLPISFPSTSAFRSFTKVGISDGTVSNKTGHLSGGTLGSTSQEGVRSSGAIRRRLNRKTVTRFYDY